MLLRIIILYNCIQLYKIFNSLTLALSKMKDSKHYSINAHGADYILWKMFETSV